MKSASRDKLEKLMDKGATVPNPECVFIGEEVSVDRMAGQGVVIYPGCKIFGKDTLLMAGAKLGYEGPVTVEDCQIGPNVELRGGFFRKSVFLEGANMGSGALVRDGCLFEEQANGAHCVGLKHTILFPFVTLGSLINFCDCLMAGGTSRKNHSEVGSSYIHFNYSPNQDKATASLIGDVPRGVMLNRPPIFLGGQGGMVGPVRVEYGTVIAAGVVCRKDLLVGGKLLLTQDLPERYHEMSGSAVDFHPGVYWHVKRQVINNVHYIANLVALRHWYIKVRSLFFQEDAMAEALHAGAVDKLDMAVEERILRFKALAHKMPESLKKYRALLKGQANERLVKQKQVLYERWQGLEGLFKKHLDRPGNASALEGFLESLQKTVGVNKPDYVAVIRGMGETGGLQGTKWLQGSVDTITDEALSMLPSFGDE
jgi:UDP-N-acetylglucosamine/UDP-N-acetylgalactosamine diphosphorylase